MRSRMTFTTRAAIRALSAGALALALAGCAVSGSGPAASFGAVEPAPAALAGSSAEAAVGAVTGPRVPLSPELAALVEPRGKAIAERAQHHALEDTGAGVTTTWRTRDGSVRGTVVPGPLYAVNAQTCRDFRHEIELGGQRFARRGTACRDGGGGWETIS